jgi:hypothetical protein
VADGEVAGMMVVDGDARRYFFRLRKVDTSNPKSILDAEALIS